MDLYNIFPFWTFDIKWILALKNIFSYLGLFISVFLLAYGFYMLSGRTFIFRIKKLANSWDHRDKNLKFYFYYGISFGLTSLSCSLPVFMSIVFSFSNTSKFGNLFLDFTFFMGLGFLL
ncbi:MAG: hypothetical protein Ct9H90mP2_03800 [Dehalococcoidia bacterium]|nr:MAG: hypothetical protein Ct9H90mP2_03800 [Dehalococcoidia bacterium]